MIRDAVISGCGRYRYLLNRRWDQALPVMAWVALNPSTADGRIDDPTVRKMCGFATLAGCGGIALLNMYALRATSPARLRDPGTDPVGPDNDRWLAGLAYPDRDGPVVIAWGANAGDTWARERRARVLAILAGVPLWCYGTTAAGEPRHPGRIAYATPLARWQP